MTVPSNLFQTVQTYQPGELAFLQNYACFVSTFNKRFENFQNKAANLGSSVTFDRPPRAYSFNTLNIIFEQSEQLVQTLTVNMPFSVGRAITAEQLIFNDMRSYMEAFGKADIMELGAKLERHLALNAISGMPAGPGGAPTTDSGPYRFFGNGVTPINSVGQLAQCLANFRETGSADEMRIYLPAIKVPDIANSMLNQFVMKRNEEVSSSWMVGEYDGCMFYRSNLMPVQTAGNVGNDGDVLTVVSTNDPTGANITQITCSGATHTGGTDANAIKSGDLGQFSFNVSGKPNVYWLTRYGHLETGQPTQFRVTADAVSSGGNVTFNVYPPLVSVQNQDQNISQNIVAGMQLTLLPTHRAGLLITSNAGFLAMPMLPDTTPYPSANKADPKTGARIRSYYGMTPFQNQYGYAHDCIVGATVVPEDSMRLIFPL